MIPSYTLLFLLSVGMVRCMPKRLVLSELDELFSSAPPARRDFGGGALDFAGAGLVFVGDGEADFFFFFSSIVTTFCLPFFAF